MPVLRFSERKRARGLKELPLFASCTLRELRGLASVTTEVCVEAGRSLTVVGERGIEFFVVVSGLASVWRDGTRVDEIETGSFFGEIALLDRGDRTATVVADTDMRVLVLTRQEFWSSRFFIPPVAERMVGMLGERLRRAVATATDDDEPVEPAASQAPTPMRVVRLGQGLDHALAG